MRIVSGRFKGQPIAAPKGRDTRPTSDNARESLFNILAHAGWAPDLDGARVIDLFAGTGALGFEAISRGAAFALFVETDSAARGAIRETIDTLSLFGITRLHRRSATDLGPKPAGLGSPFNLAFLDPPYGQGLVEATLPGLLSGGWLTSDALIIAEVGKREDVDAPGVEIIDERSYGAAKLYFMKAAQQED